MAGLAEGLVLALSRDPASRGLMNRPPSDTSSGRFPLGPPSSRARSRSGRSLAPSRKPFGSLGCRTGISGPGTPGWLEWLRRQQTSRKLDLSSTSFGFSFHILRYVWHRLGCPSACRLRRRTTTTAQPHTHIGRRALVRSGLMVDYREDEGIDEGEDRYPVFRRSMRSFPEIAGSPSPQRRLGGQATS